MFNTGDLGRWRPDGQLDHLGRIDDQVKVKGFRVELDGVAAALEVCLSFHMHGARIHGSFDRYILKSRALRLFSSMTRSGAS